MARLPFVSWPVSFLTLALCRLAPRRLSLGVALFLRPALGLEHRYRDGDGHDYESGPYQESQLVTAGQRVDGGGAIMDQALAARGRQGREHGEPHGRPYLDRRVDQARGETSVPLRRPGHRQGHERRERGADAGAEKDGRRQHVSHVLALHGHAGEQGEPGRDEHEPGQERPPRAEAHDEPFRVAHRQGTHHDGSGQEGKPRLERVVSEHPLEVEHPEEEHSEHPCDGQRLDDVRSGHVARAEDPERYERVSRRSLAHHEGNEQGERGAAEPQRQTRAPAVVGGRLDDGVDAEHKRAGDKAGPGDVGSVAETDALFPLEYPQRERRRNHAHGDVYEEDPVPAHRLGEDAAGEQPYRAASGGDEAEDPYSLGLLARLGEHRDYHAKNHSRGHGAAYALDEPGRDQQPLALRQTAQQRSQSEHAEAGEEHAPAGDEVPEVSCEQEEAAEGDQVRVDYPREARLREAEIALNRRERNVYDGSVQDDHEHPYTEHVEGDPTPFLCLRTHEPPFLGSKMVRFKNTAVVLKNNQ